MNRDEVVRICRVAASGTIGETDVNIVLMNYCLEHEKPYYETSMFIIFLLQNHIAKPFFIEALKYYERKYSINKLWSAPNNLGQRQLIQVN